MKLLHTSDWHLGRSLYGRKRDEEFAQFLQWMVQTVREREIDVLVVAGDVFDTATPGNRAQALYYQFLHQMVASPCRHIVIVAGNHDSPSFLNAPGDLLRAFDVHVIGQASTDVAQQVVVLRDEYGEPGMLVCAVPYLRDRDVRVVSAGESMQDKDANLVAGIRDHYEAIAQAAQDLRTSLGRAIPIIATGHLYTAGGQVLDGDGVRDLYIGSLGQVHARIFSDVFDYVALGHLHVPQIVDGQTRIRYSGSPLPMGFGEARQQKVVCQVTFDHDLTSDRFVPEVETIGVPVFQRLRQVRGDLQAITGQLEVLREDGQSCWIEVLYDGQEIVTDLRQRVEQAVADSPVEVLRVKVNGRSNPAMTSARQQESLEDLTPMDVFERCLEAYQVPDEQRSEMRHTYQEALALLEPVDEQASRIQTTKSERH
ncbi:exonuclease SbcCD subunit D C-terminal domain-containing protein [Orrella marina]|uniref:Nuclease SbcCD subunit D n=1 Tax=Orrella marina TaxID=2163011 RepID=A0A2R4XL50_9BURK|nr:exonuclease SbcCD subunit D C-terminal domain-containing protein [Orrella marina]AWB34439.1 exonuclease sbcCD subunit D [Orrella marina]